MRGVWKKSKRWNKITAAACAAGLFLTIAIAAQEGTRPAATKQKIFPAGDTFLTHRSENLETIRTDKTTLLRLIRQSDQKPVRDDLLIDFENDSLFSNPAHQGLISKASFEREPHNGMNGKSGRFTLRGHKLIVRLPTYLHLAGGGLTQESGDFSFACEFEPNAADGEILRRENFSGGKQYLFSIAIANGRITVKLRNLMTQTGNGAGKVLESTELKAIDKIKPGKRNLLVLTYSEAAGVLRLEINGREQAVFTLKRDAGENYSVTFDSLKAAPFTLFSPYRGYADNILFSNRVLNDEDIRHFGALKPYGDRYDQRVGFFTSGIFDMGYSQSTIALTSADTEASKENRIRVSARCIDRRFDPQLSERDLPFTAIGELAEKKCRFIQFKSVFTADNAGETSPLLKSIKLEYRENPPPDRPLVPKVISVKTETLELELMPNTELDVVRGGRYLVYYGHKRHKAEGAIYFSSTQMANGIFKGEKIAHKVPIRLKLTNDTISQNKAWADKNPRFRHRYPVFENGVGYYFWVTACDNAWGEAQEFSDHESAPSEAVFARFE